MKLTKKQAEDYIREFFNNIENKSPEQTSETLLVSDGTQKSDSQMISDIRKIKRLAMHHKIRLGELRKKFCKFCFYHKLKVVKIKNRIKTLKCENCEKIMRWKI